MIADHDTLLAAEQEQANAMRDLNMIQSTLANAIVLVKVMKERIEGLEMSITAEFLRQNNSAAAAKIHALADKRYQAGMKSIIQETTDSQAVIQQADLLHERLNSCREVMANERKKMGL